MKTPANLELLMIARPLFLLGCLTCLAVSAPAQTPTFSIVPSADPATLVFESVPDAVEYRIEWAPRLDSGWTNFAAAAAALDAIPAGTQEVFSVSVPRFFRVISLVSTPPPEPDVTFSVANSGASAYIIDSTNNPTLQLERGKTYAFEIASPGHPFWIKTSPVTGIGSAYASGLSTNGIQSGQILFTVAEDAPDTLYYICQFHSAMQGQINIIDPPVPAGMALIPAGSFVMGDALSEGETNEVPLHTNTLSAFYMDVVEVSKDLWDDVVAFNSGNGYAYDGAALGVETNHPVYSVSWFDAVKWCNARSQKEGLTPVYYTDAGFTSVYKTGTSVPSPDFSADGYRLPTEAEWEYAARGGLAGQRFPWGASIDHTLANYFSDPGNFPYDNAAGGPHPLYTRPSFPYTAPVGTFSANGYGLFNMAGNLTEWCWDWNGSYTADPKTDPQGPSTGVTRILRGGQWFFTPNAGRTAFRSSLDPTKGSNSIGFRTVRNRP